MIQLFNLLIDFVSAIFQFIVHALQAIISFILLIPTYIQFIFSLFVIVPSFLLPFVGFTVYLLIIRAIINKKVGGDGS